MEEDRRFTDKHRVFYIDDKFEFAVFFDPVITDKNKILEDFYKSTDWKWYIDYYKVKLVGGVVSDNLREVRITTKKA